MVEGLLAASPPPRLPASALLPSRPTRPRPPASAPLPSRPAAGLPTLGPPAEAGQLLSARSQLSSLPSTRAHRAYGYPSRPSGSAGGPGLSTPGGRGRRRGGGVEMEEQGLFAAASCRWPLAEPVGSAGLPGRCGGALSARGGGWEMVCWGLKALAEGSRAAPRTGWRRPPTRSARRGECMAAGFVAGAVECWWCKRGSSGSSGPHSSRHPHKVQGAEATERFFLLSCARPGPEGYLHSFIPPTAHQVQGGGYEERAAGTS